MALKAKNDEGDESSKNENSKFKSYITRQFKKFIKNANVKANDKDRKQSVQTPHFVLVNKFWSPVPMMSLTYVNQG